MRLWCRSSRRSERREFYWNNPFKISIGLDARTSQWINSRVCWLSWIYCLLSDSWICWFVDTLTTGTWRKWTTWSSATMSTMCPKCWKPWSRVSSRTRRCSTRMRTSSMTRRISNWWALSTPLRNSTSLASKSEMSFRKFKLKSSWNVFESQSSSGTTIHSERELSPNHRYTQSINQLLPLRFIHG